MHSLLRPQTAQQGAVTLNTTLGILLPFLVILALLSCYYSGNNTGPFQVDAIVAAAFSAIALLCLLLFVYRQQRIQKAFSTSDLGRQESEQQSRRNQEAILLLLDELTDLAEVAEKSVDIANEGGNRVRRTISGMDVIREHIQASAAAEAGRGFAVVMKYTASCRVISVVSKAGKRPNASICPS